MAIPTGTVVFSQFFLALHERRVRTIALAYQKGFPYRSRLRYYPFSTQLREFVMARAEQSLVPSPHFRSRAAGRDHDSALAGVVAESTQRTCDWLLSRQHEDGYWCGELEGD